MRPAWPVVVALALCAATATAADPKPKGETLVPYTLSPTKHVIVRVKLNGKGPYNFIMDTGAPPVLLLKKVAKELGVKADDAGWVELDKFEFEGGLVVPDVRTRVTDLPQAVGMNAMGLAGVELHGVIGYEVLARFKITYDFTSDKLKMSKLDYNLKRLQALGRGDSQGSLDAAGPFMKLIAGLVGISPDFTVAPRGNLGLLTDSDKQTVTVTEVLDGSPAAKAGFQKGDAIKAIALGKPTGGFRNPQDIDVPNDMPRILRLVIPGQKAKITVARGGKSQTLTVTFGKGL